MKGCNPITLSMCHWGKTIWVFIQSFAVMKMMTPSWGTRNLGESCKSLMKQDYYYQLNTKEMKHHGKLSETFPFPTHHAKLPCPKNLPTFQSFTESQAQEVSKSFPWCVWTMRHALLLGPWQDGWSKEGSISNSNLRNKQQTSFKVFQRKDTCCFPIFRNKWQTQRNWWVLGHSINIPHKHVDWNFEFGGFLTKESYWQVLRSWHVHFGSLLCCIDPWPKFYRQTMANKNTWLCRTWNINMAMSRNLS